MVARDTNGVRDVFIRDLPPAVAAVPNPLDFGVVQVGTPATQVVTLHGLEPSPEATGRVIWNPTSGGHVFVAGLPAAPAGSAYEMWTIGEGAPQPAGLFKVDASGRGTHRIAAVEDGKPVKVFAITLEPEAGVPAPTGPMVLASK